LVSGAEEVGKMPFNKVVRVVFWLIAISFIETLRLRAPQKEVEADAA
jgi:hypothetical protein